MRNQDKNNIKFFEVFNGDSNTVVAAIKLEVIPNDESIFSAMTQSGDFNFSMLHNGFMYYLIDLKDPEKVYSNSIFWPTFNMVNAHNYIVEHWDILQSGEYVNLFDQSVKQMYLEEIKYEYTASVLIVEDNTSFTITRVESSHSDFCEFMNTYCTKLGNVTWYISKTSRCVEEAF